MSIYPWQAHRKPAEPGSTNTLTQPIGASEYEDRVIGTLLGCVCGDVLGANLEKVPMADIKERYGRVSDFIGSAGRPLGQYTDDSEMTLALASSLVHRNGIDPAYCATAYAYFYQLPATRGYGGTTKKILKALSQGVDYRTTGTLFLPGGSFANGGVMRIAPIGVAFRNAPDVILQQAVTLALQPTHTHPEGIDGAWMQAKLIGWLIKLKPDFLNPNTCITWLQAMAKTEIMHAKLVSVERGLREEWDNETLLNRICTKNERGHIFQIHAAEAFACALWILLRHYQNPEEAIIHAVGMGGDSDTIGAIVGAQVGALHGTAWIPHRWFDNIENEPKTGRDVFIEVGKDLAKLDLATLQLAPWPKKRSIFTQFRRPTHSP